MNVHENFSQDIDVAGGSNRGFGLVFGVVFIGVALWPLLEGSEPRYWAIGISAAFFLLALCRPAVLAPLNRVWTRIGLLMHKVVNPLVLGLMFYVVITPVGLFLRAVGKDPLRLKLDPDATSYWIKRSQPGPSPETMKRQF